MLFLIGMDSQHPSPSLRLGAERTTRTSQALGRVEFDMDHLLSMTIKGGNPVAARLANRTSHLLCLPINRKLGLVEAMPVACLPTRVLSDWPNQRDLGLPFCTRQDFCVQIARIDNMFF